MDAARKEESIGEVRGAAGFPVVTVLLSFVLAMLGWGTGNAIVAVVGLLGLLGSVVGMEFIVFGPTERSTKHTTSESKIMHA